jgi:hypothetical protein
VGQQLLQRIEAEFGRKVQQEYLACYGYDLAQLIVHALGDARPMTGAGVRDALERVKFLPAASGGVGTLLRFGKYMHHGWVGSEYFVARRVLPGGVGHVYHGSIKGTRGPVSPSAMEYPDGR